MENKIEVYKDSNGKLYENRKDYYINEYSIIKENQIKKFESFLNSIKEDPENYYKIIKGLYEYGKSSENNMSKQYKEKIDFIKEAKKYINNSNQDYNTNQEMNSNFNSSPGDDHGITAQDLI